MRRIEFGPWGWGVRGHSGLEEEGLAKGAGVGIEGVGIWR